MDPMAIMIEDLARQVAEKALDAAEWKARALSAEARLKEMESESAEDEED